LIPIPCRIQQIPPKMAAVQPQNAGLTSIPGCHSNL